MNIFFLDENPYQAVQLLCDKHVVKMTLETAQLLCTRFRLNGVQSDSLYKPTHIHHPCQLCLTNPDNFIWLAHYFKAILDEYTFRYHKIHKCTKIYDLFVKNLITNTYDKTKLTFPKCMPDEFKTDSVIDSYKNYYRFKRTIIHPFNYTNRQIPII